MVYKKKLQYRRILNTSETGQEKTKMIYWLIPYLVAYNAANSGDWKYGPEHIFKVEVRPSATREDSTQFGFNVDMFMACRPMNSSLMQCSIESSTIEHSTVEADGSQDPSDSEPREGFDLDNVVFQVEFNEEGISKVWFLNTNGSYRPNMIRAILDTMNWGIVLSETEVGRHTAMEKSIVGTCETSFFIERDTFSEEQSLETVIDGYSFDVGKLRGRAGDGPIVIKKNRNMKKCTKNTPYFFGNSENSVVNEKGGVVAKTIINSSESRIYLGKKSFRAYTKNTATLLLTSSRVKLMRSLLKIVDDITVSLVSIKPAKTELRNTGDLANTGVGFEPGTPWPGISES